MTTSLALLGLGLLAVVGGGLVVTLGLALGAAFPLFFRLWVQQPSQQADQQAAATVAIHRVAPAVVVMHGLEDEEPAIYADHILLHGLSPEQAVQVMLASAEAEA